MPDSVYHPLTKTEIVSCRIFKEAIKIAYFLNQWGKEQGHKYNHCSSVVSAGNSLMLFWTPKCLDISTSLASPSTPHLSHGFTLISESEISEPSFLLIHSSEWFMLHLKPLFTCPDNAYFVEHIWKKCLEKAEICNRFLSST